MPPKGGGRACRFLLQEIKGQVDVQANGDGQNSLFHAAASHHYD